MTVRGVQLVKSTDAQQWEAEAPDGHQFEGGSHVLVEPFGRGLSVARAYKFLVERVTAERVVSCPADCVCASTPTTKGGR